MTPAAALAGEPDAAGPFSHHVRVAFGGGFDSNVRLAPVLEQAGAGPDGAARAGTYASASLFAGLGLDIGAATTEVEYGFLQTAYPDRSLDGSSFQMS